MSVAVPVSGQPQAPVPDEPTGSRAARWVAYALAIFVLVSLVRVLTGADDIDSAGALRAALIAAVPIVLAGIGGLWSERAGVVNIGLEGMMIMGTLGAGYFGYHYGVVAGLLGAMAFGALGGLVHAIATVTFGVDHIVSGVAINIVAAGLAAFLAKAFFSGLEGGGPTQSPPLPRPVNLPLAFLADPLGELEEKHWFLVSDAASLLRAVTDRISVVTVLALVLVAFTGWVLWHTGFGLRLRSVGESPSAAESLGVDVYRYKYIGVVVSGALAGLGGAYLALVAASGYQNGMTQGLGYIGLAAMIFGNWRPLGTLVAALLFGYTQSINLRGSTDSLHALLLVIAVVLVIVGVLMVVRRAPRNAALLGVAGLLFLIWFVATDSVSSKFTGMAPYVTTLLVLTFAAQQLRMPAADGQTYRKGSAG
ncbi:MAG TPA: ABC transporter permease [Marmoricola sp.]|jgi:simple sugar transport system permease protein|nr:ABC transporter permease [Marmoricola sp.]